MARMTVPMIVFSSSTRHKAVTQACKGFDRRIVSLSTPTTRGTQVSSVARRQYRLPHRCVKWGPVSTILGPQMQSVPITSQDALRVGAPAGCSPAENRAILEAGTGTGRLEARNSCLSPGNGDPARFRAIWRETVAARRLEWAVGQKKYTFKTQAETSNIAIRFIPSFVAYTRMGFVASCRT